MMTSGLSLADRLSRWRTRAAGAPAASSRPAAPIASPADRLRIATGGILEAPALLRVETRIGRPPGPPAISTRQAALAPIPEAHHLTRDHLDALGLLELEQAEDMVLLDTETTGLAGGTGTVAWMIGIARIRAGGLTITQWMLLGPEGEAAMLDALARALVGCQALVTYNGQAFDLPLLATRFGLYRRPDPLASLCHLDLRIVARRLPRGSAPGLRLIDLERHWLGMQREDDLPGSAAPSAWRDWLQRADGRALPGVLRHNAADLEGLARLVLHAGRLRAGLFDLRERHPAPALL